MAVAQTSPGQAVSVEAVIAGQCGIAETGLGLAVHEAGAESSLQACLRVSIVTSIERTRGRTEVIRGILKAVKDAI
jgi:hypothetical protein